MLKPVTAAPFAVLLSTVSVYAQGPAHRWPAREPPVEPKPAHQLRDPGTWPTEPASPDVVEEGRFREAFVHMCTPRKDREAAVSALAPIALRAARAENLDPFLLSAVAFYSSGCQPDFTSKGGIGLFNLSPAMYFKEGAPQPPVDRARFTKKALLDPANSLAVGARLLRMWKETHAELDAVFGGVVHRSEVSHFVWGDDVRGSGSEDLILTARRRMLLAYVGNVDKPRPSLYGINIVSPLEAPPRVATSGPGDDRDGGARQHRGLDITASLGEPVRSVADGVVVFAGANIPGAARKGPIPPDKIGRYAHRELGVGGIYLCIEHEPQRHIRTCYMHLARYVVAEADHVSAGQLIGYVGRTGVRMSPPHLHFEVRAGERFTNPCRTLGDLVIPPKATMTHLYMLKAKRERARKLRAEAAAARAQPKV